MTNQKILSELLDIAASADVLKERCHNLRKKMERFYAPSSPGRGKKVSRQVIAQVLANRRKNILKSQ